MDSAENFLLEFHRRNPGCTRIAFACGKSTETGTSSYELLSSLAVGRRVLDLGCGDAHLLSLLGDGEGTPRAIGIDLSPHELREAQARVPGAILVRANARSLPFGPHSFSLVVSHFAFHLMSDLTGVIHELARILEPGGRFATIIGGGPRLGDPFELFLELLLSSQREDQKVPPIGERRGRTDAGLRELFAHQEGFVGEPSIEDFHVDFGGTFDEVWTRLSTVYDLMHYTEDELQELRERFRIELGVPAENRIPCTMAIRRVIAQRAW